MMVDLQTWLYPVFKQQTPSLLPFHSIVSAFISVGFVLIQETTNKYINKWNNQPIFLSLCFSLSNQSINNNKINNNNKIEMRLCTQSRSMGVWEPQTPMRKMRCLDE